MAAYVGRTQPAPCTIDSLLRSHSLATALGGEGNAIGRVRPSVFSNYSFADFPSMWVLIAANWGLKDKFIG